MERRQPGRGRYAHTEREQRWLLGAVPGGAHTAVTIDDRYLRGTTLRLRRVVDADGGVVCKLTQKVRVITDDPHVVLITNIYVSPDELALLWSLPGDSLRKTRRHLDIDGRRFAIDEFHDDLAGLVLAEVELAPDERRLVRPAFALVDVTHDDRYSGGALATVRVVPPSPT